MVDAIVVNATEVAADADAGVINVNSTVIAVAVDVVTTALAVATVN